MRSKRLIVLSIIFLGILLYLQPQYAKAAVAADNLEPNNTMATAKSILKQKYWLSLHDNLDIDFLNLTLNAGETIHIFGFNVTNPVIIYVYNTTGNTIHTAAISTTIYASFNVTATVAGQYCLRFTRPSPDLTYYTLNINGNDTEDLKVPSSGISITSPGDIEYNNGSTGSNITWIVSVQNGQTSGIYKIWRNDTSIKNGTWNSGANITLSVDGLNPSEYGFKIVAFDEFGVNVTDIVIVTVTSPSTNSQDDDLTIAGYNLGLFLMILVINTMILSKILKGKR